MRTIVIAQHDVSFRRLIRDWLGRRGHCVLEGPPTDEIRTVFQKRDVDMLIADVQPSQHDSLAIAKWWRSRCPSKPILFLGELGDPCWGEWLEDRAAGLIPRPVQPTRLLQRVAEMLAGRRTSWA